MVVIQKKIQENLVYLVSFQFILYILIEKPNFVRKPLLFDEIKNIIVFNGYAIHIKDQRSG